MSKNLDIILAVMTPELELLTIAQTAEILDISHRQVYGLVSKRKLVAWVLKGQSEVRITLASVESLMIEGD